MHKIRLRRPWTRWREGEEETTRTDVPEHRNDVPCQENLKTTIYTRRFNKPSGLDADSRVYIRIEAWRGNLISITLNDQPLTGTGVPLEIDITQFLEPHNQVRIEIIDDQENVASIDGEVNLVITASPLE